MGSRGEIGVAPLVANLDAILRFLAPTFFQAQLYVLRSALCDSLTEVRDWQSGYERFVLSVLKVLSGIALTLTVIGVFSVLAYTVDQRMSEFGIRLALGATSRDLVALVLQRGMILVLTGVAGGLAGTFALIRYLQSLLFETPPHDPVVLAAVAALLLGSAALASALPAIRATKADVARLLRSE